MINQVLYNDSYYDRWNKFVVESVNGTLFHRLDFLRYHKNRFRQNEHNLLWIKGDQIISIMPLAIFNEGGLLHARSPYGGSYGGIILREWLNYSESSQIVSTLTDYLKIINVKKCTITPPLKILEKTSSDTLLFCFLEKGFRIVNSDISSVININELFAGNNSGARIRHLERKHKKTKKLKIISANNQSAKEFWGILEVTFNKHGIKPTHTLSDWEKLCEDFPGEIWNNVAFLDDKPIAGIGNIKVNENTISTFYLCSDPAFNHTQALSGLIYELIMNCRNNGIRYIDFGTSSVNMKPRETIFRFKESFGAYGCLRHTIESLL